MLIIPELKIVVILPPRTGSGSLWRAVKEKWPEARLPARHMEADGVPDECEGWERVGIIRNPIHRLFSLFQFVKDLPVHAIRTWPDWAAHQKPPSDWKFSKWMVSNDRVFATEIVKTFDGLERRFPSFRTLHPMPETRKSQLIYLRPDLGTTILPYERYNDLAERLQVTPGRHNQARIPAYLGAPLLRELPRAAKVHMQRYFAQDFDLWSQLSGVEIR